MTRAVAAVPFGQRIATILLSLLCLIGLVRIGGGAVIPAKAITAQLLLERAFERSRAEHRPVRPWPSADMAPVLRLGVPRLGVVRIVLDSGSGQAMAFGPTLLPGSAQPGDPGEAVIAAHRDTHFGFLKDLRVGDGIDVDGVDGSHHRYRVTGHQIVRWDRFAVPEQASASGLALSTCYPFEAIRHGPLRYVVQAVLVDGR